MMAGGWELKRKIKIAAWPRGTMTTAIALLLWIWMLPQFAFAQAAERAGLRTASGFVASGDRYFAKGDYQSAAVEYQNAILLDNKFEPAHAKLGFTALKLGIGTLPIGS